MLFKGFGFSGYRSFGDEFTKIAPLKKINLIIGQNNSGKSNIITFLKEHLHNLHTQISTNASNKLNFTDVDRHRHNLSSSVKPKVGFFIDFNSEDLESYLKAKIPPKKPVQISELLQVLISHDQFKDENGYVWFVYEAPALNGKYEFSSAIEALKKCLNSQEWSSLWSVLTQQRGGDINHHWIPETVRKLPLLPNMIPPVELIPAIRKIGDPDTKPDDYSGLGIIERLATLQNPTLETQELKKKFDEINEFLRNVLENESATLDIPHDRSMILVHMDGKTLPLSSLGTGVHEVVIIAAASTILEGSIVCVEEPELHLHPLLQRKLIQYLSDKTSNQYIFTTHSAHLLDTNGAQVFHVTYSGGKSSVEAINTTGAKSNICKDLGYKASDILQANCIIWVEGPSDRIYLNFWLKHLSPKLVEGVHYSIMFYGGRLSSHLTGEDIEDSNCSIDDFVSLRKLNRNACIIIDSDKDKSRAHINATKTRLKQEFNKGPGFAWVTDGREMENYIPGDDIESAVKSVHPSAKTLISTDRWANVLKYIPNNKGEEKTANKVKVARYYVENFVPDFLMLDLKKQTQQLIEFIYDSNGMEA